MPLCVCVCVCVHEVTRNMCEITVQSFYLSIYFTWVIMELWW